MSRIYISAAHKSSGKTTVALGLCAALQQQGLSIQPFKKGPDYIDPMWLGRAANRSCHNLDFYTMDDDEIIDTVARYSQDADLSIIEGNKGLYDGLDLDGSNSNAALAKLLDTPVVLVLDARGMTRGIAPLILGYQAFDPGIRIAGIILNQLGGSRHEAKLRAVIEHYTDAVVIGAVSRNTDLEITERHLGLIPSNESRHANEYITGISQLISEQVDLEALHTIANSAPKLKNARPQHAFNTEELPALRIGIAQDAAFSFYYADDLDTFEQHNARLIPVDMMNDSQLPDIDGLFIGGGFPESCMQKLEANTAMRRSVAEAIDNGLPVYAECGGLMYLCRSLSWQGTTGQMVGTIPADCVMNERPQGRGYVRMKRTAEFPWPITGHIVDDIAAHEFHYSSLQNLDAQQHFAYNVLRGTGIDGKNDGIIYKNLLASYCHQRHSRQNPWITQFLEFVSACHNKADTA